MAGWLYRIAVEAFIQRRVPYLEEAEEESLQLPDHMDGRSGGAETHLKLAVVLDEVEARIDHPFEQMVH